MNLFPRIVYFPGITKSKVLSVLNEDHFSKEYGVKPILIRLRI